MTIADLLRFKGSDVLTIAPTGRVADLLTMLAEHNVGAVVVTDGSAVAGIVSERDIVRRLADRGREVLDGPVADIMTSALFTCTPADSVDTVAAAMTERRIRHVPVLADGALAGIVSIGDVVSSRIRQLENDRGQLEQYITG